MDSVGEGGKIWKNGIETYEMSCMKRDASPGSVHDAGCFIFFFNFYLFIYLFFQVSNAQVFISVLLV